MVARSPQSGVSAFPRRTWERSGRGVIVPIGDVWRRVRRSRNNGAQRNCTGQTTLRAERASRCEPRRFRVPLSDRTYGASWARTFHACQFIGTKKCSSAVCRNGGLLYESVLQMIRLTALRIGLGCQARRPMGECGVRGVFAAIFFVL